MNISKEELKDLQEKAGLIDEIQEYLCATFDGSEKVVADINTIINKESLPEVGDYIAIFWKDIKQVKASGYVNSVSYGYNNEPTVNIKTSKDADQFETFSLWHCAWHAITTEQEYKYDIHKAKEAAGYKIHNDAWRSGFILGFDIGRQKKER
jgi:hypothetical protein